MKLKDFNPKTAKILHDLVAYKWVKVDGSSKKSLIILPDSINDGGGEGRMGNRYTAEVLAIGPDCHAMKAGDRFLLHEYDKTETAVPWNVEDVMFVKEGAISIKLEKGAEPFMIPAKKITDKMMDEYEDY